MSPIAIYQMHDTFSLTGRGLVLAGFILEGTFEVRDMIPFDFNGKPMEYTRSEVVCV